MKFWLNLLVSIDQFFNTLAGGNCDCTISGHIGAMAINDDKWHEIKWLVDYTFAPIELNHCEDSFLADNDTDYTDNFKRVSVIARLGCLLLYLPIRAIAYATR